MLSIERLQKKKQPTSIELFFTRSFLTEVLFLLKLRQLKKYLFCVFQVQFQDGKESPAIKELYKVLKDHKNQYMQDLISSSFQRSYEEEARNLMGDDLYTQELEACGNENVVRITLINSKFQTSLAIAIEHLIEAKLQIDTFGFTSDMTTAQTSSNLESNEGKRLSDKFTILVNDIAIGMEKLNYASYRGNVYKKEIRAKYTYSYKCEAKVFINSLATNEFFKSRLIRQMKNVINLLADPYCELFRPLTINYDLIEVSNGTCWSIKNRSFVDDAISKEQVGKISPRAFCPYDVSKPPDPKYFREILENSLQPEEISSFCEDFVRLLYYNKKRHKDKVPCLVGDANSGKTSLFFPILGLVHHGNVTKQRAFNKSMISPFTEVIFIDEATESTLDIDDWKTLTQGGYSAHDVKYQTAKPFINRCPMVITSQRRLNFGPADQPAMDRRLTTYHFKSLPHPDKNAAKWLKQHPMDCVLWAAQMASQPAEEDPSDEDVKDGGLEEQEKEELRTLCLGEVLDESDCPNVEESSQINVVEASQDGSDSSQDQTIIALRKAVENCSEGSLRHRQVSRLLEVRLQEVEKVRQYKEKTYQDRQESLVSRGVTKAHAALLPRETSDPLPTPIQQDLEAAREQSRREELLTKRQRASEAFKAAWLQTTERELYQCTMTLASVVDRGRRAAMEAHQEVLQDKMKNHHLNLGTLKCDFALEERRRWCCAVGLLRKEHRYLVTSLFQTLPIIAELGESSGETPKESSPSPLARTNSSDDENELFITQGPRTQLQLSGTAAASPCPTSQKKRKHKGRKGNPSKKLSQPSIASFFPSQK